MTEKHEWVSDDLCLIEKTTGVKFYGTVCTDMEFLAKYMNDLINENEQLKSTNMEYEDALGRLEEENEQLKKEKESWKSIACNNSSFNSILLHELDIAQEQGYKLSNPFKKLMREKND